jgi:hypothetical protein
MAITDRSTCVCTERDTGRLSFALHLGRGEARRRASAGVVSPHQKPIILILERLAAFASGFLQTCNVSQLNSPPTVLDEPQTLKMTGDQSHGCAPNTKNICQELLRKTQYIAFRHVSRMEKPPTKARFDLVKRIASGRLLCLQICELLVADNLMTQRGILVDQFPKTIYRRSAERVTILNSRS